MNKSISDSLLEASDATEHLLTKLKDLTLEDKVDVAARLRAVVKNCAALDEAIKADIKKKLKGKDGVVLGGLFKAALKIIPFTRFNQSKLRDDDPDLYEQYLEKQDQQRITFEPR